MPAADPTLTDANESQPAAPDMWIHDASPGIELVYRLPIAGWPRAIFKSGVLPHGIASRRLSGAMRISAGRFCCFR